MYRNNRADIDIIKHDWITSASGIAVMSHLPYARVFSLFLYPDILNLRG